MLERSQKDKACEGVNLKTQFQSFFPLIRNSSEKILIRRFIFKIVSTPPINLDDDIVSHLSVSAPIGNALFRLVAHQF